MINQLSLIGHGGSSLSVRAAGTRPAIIFAHGFPLNNELWIHQLNAFGEKYHAIAPDFVGFGNSSREPELLEEITIGGFARDLELVRAHLSGGQPIVLCGLSMGGYVALEYWSQFAGKLRGLVIVNSKPTLDTEEARAGRMAMAEKAEQGDNVLEGMEHKLLGQTSLDSRPDVCMATRQMIADTALPTVAAAQRAMANRQNFETRLAKLAIPTLVIGGEEDPLASVAATETWASKIPDSHLEIIPASGHLTPLESPKEFNAALQNFLTQVI